MFGEFFLSKYIIIATGEAPVGLKILSLLESKFRGFRSRTEKRSRKVPGQENSTDSSVMTADCASTTPSCRDRLLTEEESPTTKVVGNVI